MPLIRTPVHGQFCWAELVAHDVQSAIAFYTNALGWTLTDLNNSVSDDMPHFQFEFAGDPVAGVIQLPENLKKERLPGVWNTYVCVDDLSGSLEDAVAAGAEVVCPITNAGEHGQVAFIRDPAGGVIGLWQSGSHGGSSLRGDPGSVCWNELATRDAAGVKDFYGNLFHWTFEENPLSVTPYLIIRSAAGEQIGGIMQMTAEWGDMPSHWSVYFHVDAVDAVTAHVQQLNGRMVVAPFNTPVGRIAVLADNQGAAFNIIRLDDSLPAESSV
ncbi:MAG: VOC family protein [Planctomyces sp.]|jgi:predicted enzyme related to lactoylglutathione lyase